MPPVTRSSRRAHPEAFPAPSSQEPSPPDQESEALVEPDDRFDEPAGDSDDQFTQEEDDSIESPSAFYSNTAQQLLEPLRETADRVTRQVEEFARCLDKFNASRDSSEQSLWDDAWALLEEFNSIARRQAQIIESSSPQSRSSSRNRLSPGASMKEQDKVQFEADIWALVHDVLLNSSPQVIDEARGNQEFALRNLHRYSRNVEIWESFMNSDNTAQEYEAILSWLQDRANGTSPEIEDVIAPLLLKADRGEGVWSSTAIYTMSEIKAQKRARSWPTPLDPSNPGLRNVHKRASDGMPLVTQLDPDARTRESAALEPPDDFYEQSAWQACWEFLRRGAAQATIEKYWAQRKELWRYCLLRVNDPFMVRTAELDRSPWLRIMNIVTNDNWYDSCRYLCQDEDSNYEFQSAVYGILCGDVKSSMKVCKTIDDHLFILFNSMLISRFCNFVEAYKAKLDDPSVAAYSPPPEDYEQIRKYLIFSQTDGKTREESHHPHKLVETAVVSKDVERLLIQLGKATAQVAHSTGELAYLIAEDEDHLGNEVAQLVVRDPDSIRVVAHLQLLYKSLGYLKRSYETQLYTIENNIVNYIGWLQREGKWNLIPLYASKLSKDRIPAVLGAILIEITDQKERDFQVRLMKKYSIDIAETLYGIFNRANQFEMAKFKDGTALFLASKITQQVGTGKFRTTKIQPNFIGEELDEQDEIAVRSAEWFKYIDAENWGKACWAICLLYKIFLFRGRLSAARELSQRASLTSVSLSALGYNARFADVTSPSEEPEGMRLDGLVTDGGAKALSPSKKRRDLPFTQPTTTREIAASQALVWCQLEQLVLAMAALEDWSRLAEEVEKNRDNAAVIRNMKKELRAQLSVVREAMYLLLDKDFLSQPFDEPEARVLHQIRTHYLPECILAYNQVLYFAGHAISRSWLVECMELAQLVATNETLTTAFVEAKRMRELMDAMAWSAQGMVEANELGKKNKGSRTSNKGERDREDQLGLWNVKWDGPDDADLGLE